jgi:hypothetical protein
MTDAKQATPHGDLIAQVLDPCLPKTEREHVAAREIERLRAEVITLRQTIREPLDAGDCFAKAAHAAECAQQNFTDPRSEFNKLALASLRASLAEKAALKLLDDAAMKEAK